MQSKEDESIVSREGLTKAQLAEHQQQKAEGVVDKVHVSAAISATGLELVRGAGQADTVCYWCVPGDSVDEFYRRAGPLSRREVQGRIECNKQVKEVEIPEHGYKLR